MTTLVSFKDAARKITIRRVLDEFPALEVAMPLCECNEKYLMAIQFSNKTGIECEKCNTVMWTCTSAEDNKRLVDLLTGAND